VRRSRWLHASPPSATPTTRSPATAATGPAELRTPGGWRLSAIATGHGVYSPFISGVSCAAPGACTAVGSWAGSAGPGVPELVVTLAERWDGQRWRVQATPSPGSRQPFLPAGHRITNVLGAVACPAIRACFAVGEHFNGQFNIPLAERWDGRRWSLQYMPTPPGDQWLQMAGISCATPRMCMAVGNYSTQLAGYAFIELWDGQRWTQSVLPTPPGSAYAPSITGVSCPAIDACTIVGWLQGPFAGELGSRACVQVRGGGCSAGSYSVRAITN
jgi:hypothetical protein